MKNQITMCPFCGSKNLYIDHLNDGSDGMDVMTSYHGDYECFETDVVMVVCRENKKHSFFASKDDAKNMYKTSF